MKTNLNGFFIFVRGNCIIKPRILFVFRRERAERIKNLNLHEGPDEMLYGLNQLPKQKYDISFIEGDSGISIVGYLFRPIQILLSQYLKVGFVLELALDNLRSIKHANIIVSTVDSCGLPIALLKWIRVINTPIIFISQGLSDKFDNIPKSSLKKIFKIFYRRLLLSCDKIIVLGTGAKKHLIEVFDIPAEKVVAIPFGIDNRFWRCDDEVIQNQDILSVGSDLARDYGTLSHAIKNEKLHIVTRLNIKRLFQKNATIESDLTDIQIRNLYCRSKLIIIPLKDVSQPSGQSATLQAMACGKVVVLSRTKGLWDPDNMKHLTNCYLIDPYRPEKIREALDYFEKYPHELIRIGNNARITVGEHYTSELFAKRISICVDTIIDTRTVNNVPKI